ncbi:hypothetical protein NPX13_g11033 [Xylaria arbuscula]|uniref:Transmembrane protein n=1 Tax=Xylaria arbuscula TaxID=114810 RepID=A0A9W8TG10_9PEZI|nr:hypothetical protein NPX13_g11033 [Xylaria arbuscula]
MVQGLSSALISQATLHVQGQLSKSKLNWVRASLAVSQLRHQYLSTNDDQATRLPTSVKMAGLQHYRLAMDPAIQKLGTMSTQRHKYFRWTPRTAGITFAYAIAVPFIVGVIAYQTDVIPFAHFNSGFMNGTRIDIYSALYRGNTSFERRGKET